MDEERIILDEKESLILLELIKNSRQSLAGISKKTGVPTTTIHNIIRRLKKKGIIEKHIAIINFSKIGFPLRINFIIRVEKKKELLDFLIGEKCVNWIKKINNGYDFIVDLFFRNLSEYESFKEKIEAYGIDGKKEHYIIEELKEDCSGLLSNVIKNKRL